MGILAVKDNKKIDLVSAGILVMDLVCSTIDVFPEKGTSEYFERLDFIPGGCAYNTGVNAKRLGLNTLLIGKVGFDKFGDSIIESLTSEGIFTCDIIRTDRQSTAISIVMLPSDGQRRIYHTPSANQSFQYHEINLNAIADSSMVHIGGVGLLHKIDGECLADILHFARINDVITSADPVFKKDIADSLSPALQYLDVFLPNVEESEYITGYKKPMDQIRFYLDKGVKITGVKMGEKGCLVTDGKDAYRLGCYAVDVKDTCGAGDAFIAGFLFGVKRDWDLLSICKFASAVAAICVGNVGAATGMLSADKVQLFMSDKKITVDQIQL